jgi:hypothetical protein
MKEDLANLIEALVGFANVHRGTYDMIKLLQEKISSKDVN